jgi:DNA polymerase I
MMNNDSYAPHKAVVFDVETTYGDYLSRVASPFSDGEIGLCAAGYKFRDSYRGDYFVQPDGEGVRQGIQRGSEEWLASFPNLDGYEVLVGHNIKCDLLWFWRHPELERFLKRGGKIWDTLYAEYLLSGQFYNLQQLPHLVPSLENVARRRKVTHKLDVVKALWDAGVRTEDVQEQTLMEYLKGDCTSTSEIYDLQIAQAVRQNQLHMIEFRMDGLLATTEMEFNGMLIDMEEAEATLAELEKELAIRDADLQKYVPELPEHCEFNWGSSGQLSALIFGGMLKYEAPAIKYQEDGVTPQYYQKKIRVPVTDDDGNLVYFKSGKNAGKLKTRLETIPDIERGPKTRKEEFYHQLPGMVEGKAKWRTGSSKDETRPEFIQYSTAAEILEEVAELGVPLVKDLLEKRGLEKDIGTYYRRFHRGKWTGMLTMVHPDGRIHHNLNHAITATSRLSSSKPNLQNLSGTGKSRVRKMFISRFGKDGRMAEGDYSQLEVVCKQVLSGDEELRRKLLMGLCQHCDWLSQMPFAEGKSYEEIYDLCKVQHVPEWVAKRKQVKPVTFGEAYGAGIPKLCASSGLDAETIEAAIALRRQVYHRMYAYDDENIEKVKASRRLSVLQTPNGNQAGIGYLRTATDTIYHFLEGDAPDWMQHKGIATSFSPTTIKNYPSQGLGGEIMQVSAGRVFRWLLANDRFDDLMLLCNTVHDCLWIDYHKSVEHHLFTVKEIMEDVCPFFNEHYPNVDWDTPFPAEFEVGPNMYDLEVLHGKN